MRLTTRSSYGVRALINLALAYDKKIPVSINEIAKEENISDDFLGQIFNQLKEQKIVKSIRGPKGGYVFAKDPSTVSVYDIVDILEGTVSAGRCASVNNQENTMCKRASLCASKEVWDEVDRKIKETLKNFTLSDLAKRAYKKDPGKGKRIKNDGKNIS